MKVLITGIYGFLGSHLAKQLDGTHEVSGLYRSVRRREIPNSVTLFDDYRKLDFTPDVIVMCHASVSSGNDVMDGRSLSESNVDFTKTLAAHFPNVKTIYVSSVSVYEFSHEVIRELSPINPVNEYAASKLQGEQIVLQARGNSVVRFSSIYGEGMKENTLIPNYCNQALLNRKIEVWGNGSRLQNYIHVSDAAALLKAVAESELRADFPLLGVSDREYSNDEVARIIASATGAKIEYVRQDGSRSVTFDSSMTRKMLNWESEMPLEKGINEYLEWKEKQY